MTLTSDNDRRVISKQDRKSVSLSGVFILTSTPLWRNELLEPIEYINEHKKQTIIEKPKDRDYDEFVAQNL